MNDCAFNYSGSKSGYTELHAITEPVVDLFGGGGGFWSFVKSEELYVNDVNSVMVSFQRMLHGMDDDKFEMLVAKLYEITAEAAVSREAYEALRRRFNDTKNPILFMAVLSCCTNNMIRYNLSGGFNQTWGQRKFNPNMERKLRAFRERIRGKKIEFTGMDFRSYPRHDHLLYFVDPPYYITSTGYNTAWGEETETSLYWYLRGLRFAMTNFITRGELTNTILENAIRNSGWVYVDLRGGKMRAQRNKDDSYREILVCDSAVTLEGLGLRA